jgi:hypothetical protein
MRAAAGRAPRPATSRHEQQAGYASQRCSGSGVTHIAQGASSRGPSSSSRHHGDAGCGRADRMDAGCVKHQADAQHTVKHLLDLRCQVTAEPLHGERSQIRVLSPRRTHNLRSRRALARSLVACRVTRCSALTRNDGFSGKRYQFPGVEPDAALVPQTSTYFPPRAEFDLECFRRERVGMTD